MYTYPLCGENKGSSKCSSYASNGARLGDQISRCQFSFKLLCELDGVPNSL